MFGPRRPVQLWYVATQPGASLSLRSCERFALDYFEARSTVHPRWPVIVLQRQAHHLPGSSRRTFRAVRRVSQFGRALADLNRIICAKHPSCQRASALNKTSRIAGQELSSGVSSRWPRQRFAPTFIADTTIASVTSLSPVDAHRRCFHGRILNEFTCRVPPHRNLVSTTSVSLLIERNPRPAGALRRRVVTCTRPATVRVTVRGGPAPRRPREAAPRTFRRRRRSQAPRRVLSRIRRHKRIGINKARSRR